ncbi:acyl-CoA thioesterase [Hyalangium rubrum]|uniref:Thioesterase family protein n=1 Tax=Hyalangium rubrum TaxID=3103134 RepID=A0ABU5H769_9BACT|nr:thioesterase family protein [Hyalangium sp. s54d21]MDY7229326.1 thioesterase family protein [Hyalangium sp. s54d21]
MPFSIRIQVAPQDLDELQHVNNVVYVRWIQEVAVAHSASVGLGLEEYRQRGALFVVRRHEVDYLRPALAGDELEVETRVVAVSPVTATRRTFIRRASDGQLLVQAQTQWAYISTTNGRPVRIPPEVMERFAIEPIDEKCTP